MATEAALLLIINIQNLTEGLDLGIVTLFLQEDGTSSESNCDDQKMAVQSEMSTAIITLSVITIIMLLFILLPISVVYLRYVIIYLRAWASIVATVLVASNYGTAFSILTGERYSKNSTKKQPRNLRRGQLRNQGKITQNHPPHLTTQLSLDIHLLHIKSQTQLLTIQP